ncbi:hypothetical protein [Thalassotalea sediminis]|nr:hypothetical protein [Thalassotalea sediminis]
MKNVISEYLLKHTLLFHQLKHLNLAQWDINVLRQQDMINRRQQQ